MLTPSQIEFRRSHWMATDSARALTGQFGGLYAVVADKLYGATFEGNEATEIGEALQSPILRFAAEQQSETGIFAVPENAVIAADPLLAAHCDAYWVIANDELIPVEAKSAGFASDYTELGDWGEAGTADVPDYPLIQLHHQMICCEAPHGYIPAWIRGRGKLLYRIERNEALCKTIQEFAHWIWDTYITPGKLPEPDEQNSALAIRAMQAIERVPNKRIIARPGVVDVANLMELTNAAKLANEKVSQHMKAMLMHAAGDAQEIELPDGRVVKISRINVAAETELRKAHSYDRVTIVKSEARRGKIGCGMELPAEVR